MAKKTKKFDFDFPVMIINGFDKYTSKPNYLCAATLNIEVIGEDHGHPGEDYELEDRFDADINNINLPDGVTLYNILEWEVSLDDIKKAAISQTAYRFSPHRKDEEREYREANRDPELFPGVFEALADLTRPFNK